MNPAEAAAKLAALNWSGVPTEHQIAVSAALETLKEIAMPSAPRYEQMVGRIKREPKGVAMVLDFETAPIARHNVVALPLAPRTRWTRLYNLDGSLWLSSCHFGPEGAWGWVLESVAHEHGVDEDQIASLEGDDSQYDGDDLVTIDGVPAYRLRHVAK
jgi:hypothetical protein